VKFQVFSDVNERDGMGVELQDDAGDTIAEIFSDDTTRKVTISTLGNDVELADIERLIVVARERLGSFEGGAPWPVTVP
jgi:hypothetical protein